MTPAPNATPIKPDEKQTTVFEKVKGDGQTPEKWHRVMPTAGDPMGMENLIVKLHGGS